MVRKVAKTMPGQSPKPHRKPSRGARPATSKYENAHTGDVIIFGLHAVEAAIANPQRKIRKLCLTDNALSRLAPLVAGRSLEVTRVAARDIDRLVGPNTVHQGAFLATAPLPEVDLGDIIARAQEPGEAGPGLIAVLDQVTDPHNVGAVLRSAAVFGVCALVITRRHAPPLAGVLAKSASGGLEHVPVAVVTNLARALEEISAAGIAIWGFDADGDNNLDGAPLNQPLALVLGAEDRGLRRLTRENCDRIVAIATSPTMTSLNVSNAAAIAFHTLTRKHA